MLHLNDEYFVDAPDGVYPVRHHSMDYRADNDIHPKQFATEAEYRQALHAQFRDYISETSVRVKDGKANLGDVYNASISILEQTGYWGKFIESLDFENEHLELSIGS